MNQRQWLQTKDNLKQNDKTHMGAEVNKMTLSGCLTKWQPSLLFFLLEFSALSPLKQKQTQTQPLLCFLSKRLDLPPSSLAHL